MLYIKYGLLIAIAVSFILMVFGLKKGYDYADMMIVSEDSRLDAKFKKSLSLSLKAIFAILLFTGIFVVICLMYP